MANETSSISQGDVGVGDRHSLGLLVELLLQVGVLALQGGDGGLDAGAVLALQLLQLLAHLLVLPLQRQPLVLQLLRYRALRTQVRGHLLHLGPHRGKKVESFIRHGIGKI